MRDGRVVLVAPQGGSLSVEHGVQERPAKVSPRRREAILLLVAFALCVIAGAVLTAAGLSVG